LFKTFFYRLVATYEEHQNLQKESETSKRKAENGYDRWIKEPVVRHINTSSSLVKDGFKNMAAQNEPNGEPLVHFTLFTSPIFVSCFSPH